MAMAMVSRKYSSKKTSLISLRNLLIFSLETSIGPTQGFL